MGILASVMKKNAVVLRKPSGAIAIRVDLDAIQRKFYDALLYVAKETLRKDVNKESFTVSLSDLKFLLDKISKEKMDKNNRYYVEKLKELKEKNAEYNILDKDAGWDIEGWVSLISELQVKRNIKTEQIEIVFDLPKRIRKALIDPKGIYANLNLVIIRGLKSKYAIILYELVKDYEKVEIPEMTIENFRKLFNVENKYPKMPDLKRWVLEPAVKELNENENIDFLVSYELIKQGKAYTHIKFHVKPKPARVKLDQQTKKVLEAEVKENNEAKELLALIPSEYRRRNRVVSLVLGSLKENGKEYTKAQIEYVNEKYESGKIKNYVAYLKNAVEKDYAGFEEIDDIGFVTVDDAIGYRGNIRIDGKIKYVEIAYIEIDESGEQNIGYDRERKYLVRLNDAETGELVAWRKVNEKKLLEFARKNIELRKKRRES